MKLIEKSLRAYRFKVVYRKYRLLYKEKYSTGSILKVKVFMSIYLYQISLKSKMHSEIKYILVSSSYKDIRENILIGGFISCLIYFKKNGNKIM